MDKTFLIRIYDCIQKIEIAKSDYYTTDCLLDCNYFKHYFTMITNDLSKQETLDADPKAIQQINVTRNLDRAANATVIFIIKRAKDVLKGTLIFFYSSI